MRSTSSVGITELLASYMADIGWLGNDANMICRIMLVDKLILGIALRMVYQIYMW
ncbi:MAG TPA: hypothetical protein VHK27_13790 [Gammaproteobacteria bacterium]|nr:hypothetical protein [Gammaproteobacteria bacterium]